MLTAYALRGGRLVVVDDPKEAVWIDLFRPEPAEIAQAERLLGIGMPSREDMVEIEASSRLYLENEAAVMLTLLPENSDGDRPLMAPVAFCLSGRRLGTLRMHAPRSFATFTARAAETDAHCADADSVLVGLLETAADRLADILERIARDVENLSGTVFGEDNGKPPDTSEFQRLLHAIGRKGDLVSTLSEALITFERMVGFLAAFTSGRASGKEVRTRIKTLSRDVHSIHEHAIFISSKVTFLLDATLGMINIQQNRIIKMFSVFSVAFMPPTLIASVYGMNFQHMPELAQPWGYGAALTAMALSATVPMVVFRRLGWL